MLDAHGEPVARIDGTDEYEWGVQILPGRPDAAIGRVLTNRLASGLRVGH